MTNYFEGNLSPASSYSTYSYAKNIRRGSTRELLSIKKYDKQSMLINNKLLSGIGHHFEVVNPLTNKQEEWHIRLSKAAKPGTTTQYLCLEGNDRQYWIADGIKFLGNLTGIHLKKNQSNMLNMLLPKIPQPLVDIFGWQLAYTAPPPKELFYLDLHYGSSDVNLKTSLAMEKSTCLQVINHRAFKQVKRKPLPQALTISTGVSLGAIGIGMLESSQLDVGDLVFLQHSNFNAGGSGTLILGPFTLYVQIELINGQYQLAINRWERNMNEARTHQEDEELISDDMEVAHDDQDDDEPEQRPTNNESDEADGLPVGDLPIKIDVRLGSIKFTVKDLNNIVEGKLYPIISPCAGQVQLMHNDMELARGQLVEVDGKLAIEIHKRWIHA